VRARQRVEQKAPKQQRTILHHSLDDTPPSLSRLDYNSTPSRLQLNLTSQDRDGRRRQRQSRVDPHPASVPFAPSTTRTTYHPKVSIHVHCRIPLLAIVLPTYLPTYLLATFNLLKYLTGLPPFALQVPPVLLLESNSSHTYYKYYCT
jgi:hypothetical protein